MKGGWRGKDLLKRSLKDVESSVDLSVIMEAKVSWMR